MARASTNWSVTDRGDLLIIGIGNSLRRDDGAGLYLARDLANAWQVAGRGVQVIETHQLVPEIAEVIAAADIVAVLFVDAAVDEATLAAGVCRLEPLADDDTSPSLGHHLGPATLLLYASQLFDRRPPAWLLRVPGRDFDHGEGLSPVTAQVVAAQVAQADSLWRALDLPL